MAHGVRNSHSLTSEVDFWIQKIKFLMNIFQLHAITPLWQRSLYFFRPLAGPLPPLVVDVRFFFAIFKFVS